jgi:CubicO group peptidase (beta-lactamase class C family)
MRTPNLLATFSIALLASSCALEATDSEDVAEAPSADTWAPSTNLVKRLQVLGQLPDTQRKIANLAYFKAASPGPSMAVALSFPDGPFYTQGFGNVGAGEPTPDTAYYIASSTKVFTAAAVLRLLQLYPNVKLDDPVSMYYSPTASVTYPPGSPPAACPAPCVAPPITIRHLITHASGLPNYGTTYPAGTDEQQPTRAQFDQMVAAASLEFYPGYNRDYSGVGIAVAGRLIEVVSGKTYAQFMTDHFLAPLGATRSSIDPATLPVGTPIAPAYNQVSNPPGSGQNVTYQLIPQGNLAAVTALAPAGHLVTTTGDMSKFLAMQLSTAILNPPSYPLTQANVALSQLELLPNLTQPGPNDPCTVVPACTDGNRFIAMAQCGAGWWYGGQAVPLGSRWDPVLGNWVQASGGSAGYGSIMWVAPDAGVAAAVLSTANPDEVSNPQNGFNGDAIDALTRDAAKARNNPAVPWTDQPLPAALERFMALMYGSITSAAVEQTFSQTYRNLYPALTSALLDLQSLTGACSSFTVQRVSSKVSAVVTLKCAKKEQPIEFTATSAAPYLVTKFTTLPSPIPPAAAGVPGRPAIALTGINGNNIPTAFSKGDGKFRATNLGETTGDPWLQYDSRVAGTMSVPGDFDCDGEGDIAVTGGGGWNTIPIAFANGDGSYHGTNLGVTNFNFPAAAATSGVKAVPGDFDGDGYGDIALTGVVGWSTIPVAFSKGNGTFRGTNLGATGVAFTQLAQIWGVKPVFGDFDGDGRGDIALVGNVNWNSIPIAYSNGDGSFHAELTPVTSGFVDFLVASGQSGVTPVGGDFDGDGYGDIALTGGAGWNTIPVAFSNGDGTFHATNLGVTSGDLGFPTYASQSNARPVFGDFDGDGNFDIALTGGLWWNTIPVAFSNGDGTFRGTNLGVVSGYTQFTTTAATSSVKPVGL